MSDLQRYKTSVIPLLSSLHPDEELVKADEAQAEIDRLLNLKFKRRCSKCGVGMPPGWDQKCDGCETITRLRKLLREGHTLLNLNRDRERFPLEWLTAVEEELKDE